MSDDPHARGGPPTYVQQGATAPTHAERTRTLVAARHDGTLSTVALDPAGYPFGSIVTFAVDDRGAPLILMSIMAEHTRNLADDPRCSLLVTAAGEGAGRLAVARATLIGRAAPVAEERAEAALKTYLAAHPDAFWARFPDFGIHRLAVEAVRYVRGFGEMSWVDVTAYTDAVPDPVAPAEDGIVQHMNDDHRGSLAEMVSAFLPVEGTVTDVRMLSCDRYGFEVRMGIAPGTSPAGEVAFGRLGFAEPLGAPDQARRAMVELVGRARRA